MRFYETGARGRNAALEFEMTRDVASISRHEHWSTPARSGPPPDRRAAPAPPRPPRWRPWLLLIGVFFTLSLLADTMSTRNPTVESLSYTTFEHDVTANRVKTATISATGGVTGALSGGAHYSSQIPTVPPQDSLAALLSAHNVDVTAKSPSSGGVSIGAIIVDVLPLVLFIGFFVLIGRATKRSLGASGGIMGIGRSKAKVYDQEKPQTRFADVAGYENAKAEVAEVVDFLKHPEHYARAGAVGPKGVLMVGPPGTGKTLMARAVAGEAGVPFLAITGSSFVELFVGVGASRVRDLFADARKLAPSIIFIDEIDAIGGRRGAWGSFATNDEREQTLNQMLAEMDGFDPDTGVVVIAATNRPETLDPALLRPGRFDRTVEIPLPNMAERAAIVAVHAKGKQLAPDVDFAVIARGTPGFSGADLANLVNEAAIHAVRENRLVVTARDFDVARDRILLRGATAPTP